MVVSEPSTDGTATSPVVTSKAAGLAGLATADAEPIELMLAFLGWQVDTVADLTDLAPAAHRLIFIDRSREPASSALPTLVLRSGAIWVIVGPGGVHRVTNDGRVHHLPTPLDPAQLEHVIEAAS